MTSRVSVEHAINHTQEAGCEETQIVAIDLRALLEMETNHAGLRARIEKLANELSQSYDPEDPSPLVLTRGYVVSRLHDILGEGRR